MHRVRSAHIHNIKHIKIFRQVYIVTNTCSLINTKTIISEINTLRWDDVSMKMVVKSRIQRSVFIDYGYNIYTHTQRRVRLVKFQITFPGTSNTLGLWTCLEFASEVCRDPQDLQDVYYIQELHTGMCTTVPEKVWTPFRIMCNHKPNSQICLLTGFFSSKCWWLPYHLPVFTIHTQDQ